MQKLIRTDPIIGKDGKQNKVELIQDDDGIYRIFQFLDGVKDPLALWEEVDRHVAFQRYQRSLEDLKTIL